jgi:hypothetical protein
MVLLSSPSFIWHKQRGSLELFTPLEAVKENANNKVVHMPPTRIGTREVNVSTKVTNIPSIREDLILVGTFQDYMNEIVGEDTSFDKDFHASIIIIKPSPIVG